jgi:hypothetical protein
MVSVSSHRQELKALQLFTVVVSSADFNPFASTVMLVNMSKMPGVSSGIATGYGLDSPGIESQWGRDFPHLSRLAPGPTQSPVHGYQVFPGGKGKGKGPLVGAFRH